MAYIRVKDNENLDLSIRRFKRAVEKAGILGEVRKHEFYEKPTTERKRLRAAAKKRHAKKLAREKMILERDKQPIGTSRREDG